MLSTESGKNKINEWIIELYNQKIMTEWIHV